jgi:hypothetical protein
MVQLGQYIAQQPMRSAGQLEVQVDPILGKAVSNFGATLGDAAAVFQQRQEQRDNFTANVMYDKFKLQQSNALDTAAETMPEGGDGFTKNFVDNQYKPERDKFLAGLPESTRGRFGQLLQIDDERVSTEAAKKEHAEVRRYQGSNVIATTDQLAQGINIQPEKYAELKKQGDDMIDGTSSFTPAEKADMKQKWEKTAQTAHLDRLLADNPQEVMRKLGVDSSQWSAGTKFAMLSQATRRAETGGEPNPNSAVSSAGAVGLMQVMPGTAAEIAKELGDKNFPQSGNDEQIQSYLSNPTINKMYGEHYLKKQLNTFGGDTEAAVIAYNAGPGVAQKWLESGKNDDVLPGETLAYKNKIMADLKPDVAKIPASDVTFKWNRPDGAVPLDDDLNKVSPVLRTRLQDAFAIMGIKEIKVNSGVRDEEHNAAVGGAKGSQHIHGNAMDIDLTGMPVEQRKELIRALSASGITGIGVYPNSIHADIGPRRAWGPSHGKSTIPGWAQGVIAEHMTGNVIPPANKGVNEQYSAIDYDQRQKYIAAADRSISQQHNQNTPDMQVARVQTRTAMMNDLASYRATGQGSQGFDESSVATYLGADDYEKYVQTRELNQRIFKATEGFGAMPQEALEQKTQEHEPVAGSPTFAQDTEVQKAVTAEVNRVMNLRTKDPARAAEEVPEVKAAKDKAFTPKADGTPDVGAVQDYVRAVLDAQEKFNLPMNTTNADGTITVHRAPIDKASAIDIGRRFSEIPPVTSKNVQEVTKQIAQKYALIKALFGDYADEVIIYSMSEYHGIDKVLATRITNMMTQINQGRDPFIKREAPKVEKSFLERLFGSSDETATTTAEEERRITRDRTVDE